MEMDRKDTIQDIIGGLEYLAQQEAEQLGDNAVYLHLAISALKAHPEAQPNEPLTLEEDLLKMDKQPVWSSREHVWGLLDIGLGCVVSSNGDLDINVAVATRTLYRRPPKEE